jgi:hypothetical protein
MSILLQPLTAPDSQLLQLKRLSIPGSTSSLSFCSSIGGISPTAWVPYIETGLTSPGLIREAFASAFAEKYTEIDKALSDDAIDILSTLRNAIVHKGGVADKEYLQRRKYLLGLPAVAEGEPIPLDGQVVSHAIGETLFCCASLMGAVDEWLATN